MNSGAPARGGWFSYENGVLLLLGLTFGFLFFDRNAAGNLVPFITNDLKLNNAQIGLVTSALSLTWAISAYVFGVPVPFPIMLIVGGIVAIGAMIGDLSESLIKRNIGIKDMGSFIPGHGGLMDRIDALLVTVPLTFYIAIFLDWLGYP